MVIQKKFEKFRKTFEKYSKQKYEKSYTLRKKK